MEAGRAIRLDERTGGGTVARFSGVVAGLESDELPEAFEQDTAAEDTADVGDNRRFAGVEQLSTHRYHERGELLSGGRQNIASYGVTFEGHRVYELGQCRHARPRPFL